MTSTIKLPQSCASVRLETIKETGALAANPLQMQPDEGQRDVAKIERAGRMASGAPTEAMQPRGEPHMKRNCNCRPAGSRRATGAWLTYSRDLGASTTP